MISQWLAAAKAGPAASKLITSTPGGALTATGWREVAVTRQPAAEAASATALRLDPIEPGSETYGPPRRLVAGADASTFSPAAEGFYIEVPGDGMTYVPWNAEGPVTGVRGERFEVVTHGRGAIALVDTASTTHTPGGEFRFTGVANLSQLQSAPGGATAWQADFSRPLGV